jgi:thiamine pyrophosphate-dependent acetolactate synthase large subunit-like protein
MGYPSGYLSSRTRRVLLHPGFQSIGLGLATAIGAALARPDRLPVAALGDGGFTMAIAELETAVRLRIGMLVVVYDDAGTGPSSTTSPTTTTARSAFPDTDLAAIAAGYGCDAARRARPRDLAPVERLAGRPAGAADGRRRQGARATSPRGGSPSVPAT